MNLAIGNIFFGVINVKNALFAVYVFIISARRGYPVNSRFDIRKIGDTGYLI